MRDDEASRRRMRQKLLRICVDFGVVTRRECKAGELCPAGSVTIEDVKCYAINHEPDYITATGNIATGVSFVMNRKSHLRRATYTFFLRRNASGMDQFTNFRDKGFNRLQVMPRFQGPLPITSADSGKVALTIQPCRRSTDSPLA